MGHESFGEKIIFPSAPVPGINNDQSLNNQSIAKLGSKWVKTMAASASERHVPHLTRK